MREQQKLTMLSTIAVAVADVAECCCLPLLLMLLLGVVAAAVVAVPTTSRSLTGLVAVSIVRLQASWQQNTRSFTGLVAVSIAMQA